MACRPRGCLVCISQRFFIRAILKCTGRGFGNLQLGLLRQHAADWQSEATLTMGTGRGIKLATEKGLGQKMCVLWGDVQ